MSFRSLFSRGRSFSNRFKLSRCLVSCAKICERSHSEAALGCLSCQVVSSLEDLHENHVAVTEFNACMNLFARQCKTESEPFPAETPRELASILKMMAHASSSQNTPAVAQIHRHYIYLGCHLCCKALRSNGTPCELHLSLHWLRRCL